MLRNTRQQFFRDILQNLLDNSIKAVKDSLQKIIRCTVVTEKEKLVIKLSDSGCGIPKEKRTWVLAFTTQQLKTKEVRVSGFIL